MATATGYTDMYTRWNSYDEHLYNKLLGEGQYGFIRKSKDFLEGTKTLPGAIGRGIIPGLRHTVRGFKEATGLGFLGAGVKHYTFRQPAAAYVSEWDKYFIGVHPSLGPKAPSLGVARAKSALKVIGRGIIPAFTIYGASESEHGMAIGMAEQIAGFTAWGFAGSMGMQLGGWAGGGAMRAAGSGLSKVPGVKKLVATALGKTVGKVASGAGALVGGPIGWLVGGLAAFEGAVWGVGMALHTLPTFAKQFRLDMNMSGYGGDYVDSAGAITMRQRSLQVMGKSFVNARSALGQEGALLHA